MTKRWEIHFCEGSYFMAKEVGTESGIIDNTLTELIGKVYATRKSIKNILDICQKSYEINKIYPYEEV